MEKNHQLWFMIGLLFFIGGILILLFLKKISVMVNKIEPSETIEIKRVRLKTIGIGLALGGIVIMFNHFSIADSKKSNDLLEPNRDNYYNYFLKSSNTDCNIKTDWIDKEEALEIIYKELDTMGYQIKKNILFVYDKQLRIMLHGFELDKKFGFFFVEGHSMTINVNARNTSLPFQNFVFDYDGIPYIEYIENIRPNIFIFKEDWYWYQEGNCENVKLISKQKIIEIIKQDLHYYLMQFEQP